jgi:nucleotide-binding universal stress UspA family protein
VYAKILVPLDGSKLAEVALSHVEPLAWELHSSLILQGASCPVLLIRAKRED